MMKKTEYIRPTATLIRLDIESQLLHGVDSLQLAPEGNEEPLPAEEDMEAD